MKTLVFLMTLFALSAQASDSSPGEDKFTRAALEMAPKMIFLSLGSTSERPGLKIVSLYGEEKRRGIRALCDFAFEEDEYGDPLFVDMDCRAGTRMGHILFK